jgi:hypothetical protein
MVRETALEKINKRRYVRPWLLIGMIDSIDSRKKEE